MFLCRRLLLYRRWLDLQRSWSLFLARNCCALCQVAAKIAREFASVVGVDLRVVSSPRHRHICETVVNQQLTFSRIHVNQDAFGSLSLAAVARHRVTVIEMGMLADVERNRTARVYVDLDLAGNVDFFDGAKLAIGNV